MIRRGARPLTWLLSLVLAWPVPGPVTRPLLAGAGAVLLTVLPVSVEARSRSSGGYSRPSSSSRTPSLSSRPTAPRTPSTSGGYGRPSTSVPTAPAYRPPSSAGDQALSRERAAQALQQQRAAQDQARARAEAAQRTQPRPGSVPQAGSAWSGGSSWWDGSRRGGVPARTDWYAERGWSAPPYAAAAPRSFGVWDGLFLWFMLDNLSRPGYADFFRSHRDDPGVRQWRQQAEALARDNEALKGKLAELDSRSDGSGGWVEVPPDIPPALAAAQQVDVRTPDTGGGGGLVIAVVLLLMIGGAVVAVATLRRRARTQGGSGPMTPLQTAAAMARNAISGRTYRPSQFRVGQVITVDLAPFILAAGATRVTPPEASPGGAMTVAAVGHIGSGATALVRLHLADRRGLFQIHLDAAGAPDECRYFMLFDEVAPADADEWSVWLDPREGLIGWPEFETKDGRRYARAWSPGSGRVMPVDMSEEITSAEGAEQIRLQSMLYAAPTGLAAPAPDTEYLLVSAVERAGQAWVELRAGIDINPASLDLA